MTAIHNNRRRFLAFLGLAGAPAALWAASARAQTDSASSSTAAPTSLMCQTRTANSAAIAEYSRSFDVVNSQLADNGTSQGSIKLTEAALSHEFAPGFDTIGLMQAGATDFDLSGPNFVIDGAEYPELMTCTFTATLKVPAAPIAVSVAQIFTQDRSFNATASFEPITTDSSSILVTGTWELVVEETLTTTFYVRVTVDGVAAAQFGFDFSQLNWKDFQAAANKQYAGKAVTVDASGATNVQGCSAVGVAPCFFTTAASLTLGLSDDCWELRTLRAFRDGPLATTAEGRALTARYYAEAPRLVDGVNRRRDADRVWLAAYWTHILPCALMARLGLHKAAIAHYTRLFARLEKLAA